MLRSTLLNSNQIRSFRKGNQLPRFFCNKGDNNSQIENTDVEKNETKKFDDRDIIGDDPSMTVKPQKFVSIEDELDKLNLDAYNLVKKRGDALKKGGIILNVQPRDKEGNIILDRDVQLKMDHYKMLKETEVYNEKQITRAKGVLDFTERSQMEKSHLNVEDMLDNGFVLNGVSYPGSIVAFANQVFLWDVFNCYDIRRHMFDVLEVMKPAANYVIIGTGNNENLIDDTIQTYQQDKHNIKVDACPTFQAISTYNMQQEDDVGVVLFAIPHKR